MTERTEKQIQTGTYLVTLQGINEHISLDDLPKKLRLICGGTGVRLLDIKPVDQEEQQTTGAGKSP